MPLKVIAAVIAPLLAVIVPAMSLPAEAQYLGPGLESNIELTKHDLGDHPPAPSTSRSTARRVGATASWSNPDSGNYGTITLLKKYRCQRPAVRIGRIYLGNPEDGGFARTLHAEQLPAAGRALADLMSAAVLGARSIPLASE